MDSNQTVVARGVRWVFGGSRVEIQSILASTCLACDADVDTILCAPCALGQRLAFSVHKDQDNGRPFGVHGNVNSIN